MSVAELSGRAFAQWHAFRAMAVAVAGVGIATVAACSSDDGGGGPGESPDGAAAGSNGQTGGGGGAGGSTAAGGSNGSGTGGSSGNGTGGASTTGDAAPSRDAGSSADRASSEAGDVSTRGTDANASQPPCLTGAGDAVILGDSYVTGFLSPALQPALAALDPSASNFRNYAVAGTSLANGGVGLIPPQLDTAVAANPIIKFAIMSGGGNDILLCDNNKFPGCQATCSVAGSSGQKVCTDIVAAASAAAEALMVKMSSAGVKDVIYFFYPHIVANNGGYTEILDYARPLAKAKCNATAAMSGGRLTCHFIDLVAPFAAAGGDMNPANFSIVDGIHPSQAGQNIIAQEIWATMQSACLGMASMSECCAP
jgi:lysophospholipase L1-like esterase